MDVNLIYFIYVSAAIGARASADGIIELIFSDGSTRPATLEEITGAKRRALADQINAERARREALGLSYQFPDGQTGVIQMRDGIDFRNINGLASAASIHTLQGNTSHVFKFSDAENNAHDLTPAEMLSLGLAVQQRVSDLYASASAIKGNLMVSDPDQFDISSGWPP